MAEERRIPQVEQLESRDMPSAPGVPYLAPPVHLGATDPLSAPQIVVVTPAAGVVTNESPIARDLVVPPLATESSEPHAAVWQQSVDVVFSALAEHGAPISTAWPPTVVLRQDASPEGTPACQHPSFEAASYVAAAAVPSSLRQTPTMAVVQRYAARSVSRHRVDDPDDAVQQICLEWLLLAATAATTFDDVRRIVARVIDRAYRRLKKRERALDLLDVPVHGDPVEKAFRDMQLDRDLGVKDLTDREWQAVGLRRQGYTFAEIGDQLGMRKQRAREMCNFAAACLRRRYRD